MREHNSHSTLRRGFTLIELLVVIAIIAILAAILFPVFAQAKTAAKKTAAISNQKQISLGLLMYIGDNDDQYPRRRGCELNSSLNSKLNDGVTRCGGANGFAHSMTWQTWQKYIMPYVKNVQIFEHPVRQKSMTDWNNNGQILNGFALNLGLTGGSTSGFISTPWTGGTQSGIANVSAAMLLLEMPNTYAAPFVAPKSTVKDANGDTLETVYPMAIREYWRAIFLKQISGCTTSDEPDAVGSGPHQGVVAGMADGSAKFIPVMSFLGQTPTLAQYMPSTSMGQVSSTFNSNCRRATSAFPVADTATPVTSVNFPLWGLGQ
ncbi:MAG: prepilin-type N-terminal cleavage/methylation domain-containing protein [Chthonomonas sp.]|nr:prepilin-type N-terminal cleavage/methylation domain-containing protein [Chthonomonas sp.]